MSRKEPLYNRSKVAIVKDCEVCGKPFIILPGARMRTACNKLMCGSRYGGIDYAKRDRKKPIPRETCRIEHRDTVTSDGRLVHVEWRH